MKHEFQHGDSPTWCKNCGTFDTHCIPDEECWGDPTRKFDMTKPENHENFLAYKVLKHTRERNSTEEER